MGRIRVGTGLEKLSSETSKACSSSGKNTTCTRYRTPLSMQFFHFLTRLYPGQGLQHSGEKFAHPFHILEGKHLSYLKTSTLIKMDGALNWIEQATVDQLVSEDVTQATAILHYVQVLYYIFLNRFSKTVRGKSFLSVIFFFPSGGGKFIDQAPPDGSIRVPNGHWRTLLRNPFSPGTSWLSFSLGRGLVFGKLGVNNHLWCGHLPSPPTIGRNTDQTSTPLRSTPPGYQVHHGADYWRTKASLD